MIVSRAFIWAFSVEELFPFSPFFRFLFFSLLCAMWIFPLFLFRFLLEIAPITLASLDIKLTFYLVKTLMGGGRGEGEGRRGERGRLERVALHPKYWICVIASFSSPFLSFFYFLFSFLSLFQPSSQNLASLEFHQQVGTVLELRKKLFQFPRASIFGKCLRRHALGFLKLT